MLIYRITPRSTIIDRSADNDFSIQPILTKVAVVRAHGKQLAVVQVEV